MNTLLLRLIGREQKIFSMADRTLKVYHSYRSKDKQAVPEVRLIGQWLAQSGFKIGEQVQITVRDQEIIIKPVS
ncbi:hypothetical protein SanaruYs_39390 [Chryseotalea sanaruensis]|uniref:Toxin SymE-like domain-containing protein n=2 Tax=Chryseotalea sanaruensis TaxID=2482724 RepID=A0A401UFR3_9BACT|nr:hypothetical protein SanaruYs_39390 [Chryseotalea sanaruensis]